MSQRPTGKNATILGERLVFSGFQPDTGYEIWASDGTAEGTVPLGEILPGPAGQEVRPVTSGHRVFFAAVGPDGDGKELWVWDPVVFADGFESGDLHAWSSH